MSCGTGSARGWLPRAYRCAPCSARCVLRGCRCVPVAADHDDHSCAWIARSVARGPGGGTAPNQHCLPHLIALVYCSHGAAALVRDLGACGCADACLSANNRSQGNIVLVCSSPPQGTWSC